MSLLLLCKSLRLYKTIRSLHLYAGLFVTPFLIVFAVSVVRQQIV